MSTNKLRMKLLFDQEKKRVLFAEVGKDVVDFLFYLLSLPMATVIDLLSNSNKVMVGCLNNLYQSVEKLDKTYIQPGQSKDSLLHPILSLTQAHLLLPDIQPIQTNEIKMYKCPNSSHDSYFVKDPKLTCPEKKGHDYNSPYYSYDQNCGSKMTCLDVPVEGKSNPRASNCVGFVNDVITYMVKDDLMITPMSTISSICLLNQFNIKDVANLEEIVVDFGMDEGLKILEASLKGKKVLTQVFSFKCFSK